MRPVALASLLLVAALPGCKKKHAAPPATRDAAPAVAAAPDAAPRPGADLSAAPPEHPATADKCKLVGDFAVPLLRVVALDRKVPNDQIDGVEQALHAAFIAACTEDQWPSAFIACVGKNSPELFSWQRCVARLPDAARQRWDATMDDVIAKAGGTATPGADVAPPEGGVTFEALCPGFVAEMARLDDCGNPGMYVPDLENVWIAGRSAAVGGVIPPDKQAAIKKLCDDKTAVVREVEKETCGRLK